MKLNVSRKAQLMRDPNESGSGSRTLPSESVQETTDFLPTISGARVDYETPAALSGIWEQVFRQAGYGKAVATADGSKLELMNPAFAMMHGYTVEELTGSAFDVIVAPEAARSLVPKLNQTSMADRHPFESIHVRKDGTKFPVLVDVTLVRNAKGEVEHTALNVHDVSLLKVLETGLRADRAEAERANNAKGDFLSRMSHEMRTPLNVILGFAQVMQLDALPPAHEEAVGNILQAGRDLLLLIDDVLDISRYEAGIIGLSMEPVGIAEAVADVLRLMEPLALRHGVVIHNETVGCDWSALADRQRLRQVLVNLVSNAIKYNIIGGSLTLAATSADGRIAITVEDTGIGIPEGSSNRLFSPFERLGRESTEIEGSGLGLSICKSLVDAMDGSIAWHANSSQGSVFEVDLASVESAESKVAAILPSAPSKTESAGVVLYIEDNLANFRVVQQVVSRRPHVTVIPAIQGSIGLEFALDHRPDLILLDLGLPDLPGEEVLLRLLAQEETKSIPVIITSADATPGRIDRLLGLGAVAYLTKPINVGNLLEMIDGILPPWRGPA